MQAHFSFTDDAASTREADHALDRLRREAQRYPTLSREETGSLAVKAQTGDREALDRLVGSNLGLVIHIAKRYFRRHANIPAAEIVSAGMEGVMEAALHYDIATFETRFSTYAVWWIRKRILEVLAELGYAVSVAPGEYQLMHRVLRTREHLSRGGHEPSPEEIATALDTGVARVRRVLEVMLPPLELDAPVGEGDAGDAWKDVLSTDDDEFRHPSGDRSLTLGEARQALESALAELNSRDAEVVRLLFPLDGSMPLPVGRIAALYGVTDERIRQLRDRAFRSLRANPTVAALMEDLLGRVHKAR